MKGNNVTLEFASTGSPGGFECILDRVYGGACKSLTRPCSYIAVVDMKRIAGILTNFSRPA